MKFELQRFFLEFNSTFTIAHGSRTGTDIVLLKLEHDGITAWGESSLPPYLPETSDSVIEFITAFFSTQPELNPGLNHLLEKLKQSGPGNFAAKACVDIALHNWFASAAGVPVWKMLGLKNHPLPPCTFTIGMDEPDVIREKVAEAEPFNILKVKLGGNNDREIIETIREITTKPLCVDVNQGWKSREEALEMIQWLSGLNTLFVEQPLPKDQLSEMVWLKERSPLPLYADESVQVPEDVVRIRDGFHGINVKLMKCGGISEGLRMIQSARDCGLSVLVGSMSETSCGIMAAAQLSSVADFVDLDGPLLTKNNPFESPKYYNGKLIIGDILKKSDK